MTLFNTVMTISPLPFKQNIDRKISSYIINECAELRSFIVILIYHMMVNWFSFYKESSTFHTFCRTLHFKNQTINQDFMALLSDILHGLHFYSFFAKATKWKCRNMFILCLFAKVLVKSWFIGRFSTFTILQDSQETELSDHVIQFSHIYSQK